MHEIENDFLKVTAREFGAELISVFSKKTNTEHLWQADEKFWGWHAPVLFPVVGRCLGDQITIENKHYAMEKHGFARKSTFKLLELSETRMVFSLQNNEETEKIYPYKFEFLIAYRLKENQLIVSYEVINKDDKPIYFQLGGHPALSVPFHASEKYEDYYLAFEKKETTARHFINANGFFDGNTDLVLQNQEILNLKSEMFNKDAIILKDLQSKSITIKSNKHSQSVSVDFTGFPYLGLWAKEGASYVCIEPWFGCADTVDHPVELKNKEGVLMVEEGEQFNPHYTISIR